MIGEIRDLETARIAIQAALTGHLVFSTLHTNDAASAITRLTDMGIEPYLVSSSVLAIMAQRLVRRVCSQCRRAVAESPSPDAGAPLDPGTDPCPNCSGTGYRGRTGIFELLVLDDEIRELIQTNARAHAIKQAGLRKGLCTLRDDGLCKVAHGVTTREEVFRVTQDDTSEG
jgi:general secretion pathway protein E